tara:strand:- start:50 stop:1447 length:1398 start_codon:yes stop_codon:yes gene_type:complete
MLYDFIIIGTGPSGSVLASNLATKGFKIAMIDRATNIKKTSDRTSFIYSPYINKSPFDYTPLFSNQLGGNSALWNNKIYLLSKDEFDSEKWGFNYEELKKNSKDLSHKLKLNHNKICNTFIKKRLKYSESYRASELGNLFNHLNIRAFKNIDIFTHSSPVELVLDNKKTVKKVIIKSLLKKRNIELKIKNSIIFCAGGLGNPNLLQNLLKDYNKNIGKNLCDHPHINVGKFDIDKIKNSLDFSKYFFKKKIKTENNLYFNINRNFVGIQLDLLGDPVRLIKKIYCKINQLIPKFLLIIFIKYYSLFTKILNKILFILSLKSKYSYEFFFSQIKSKNNNVIINKSYKDNFLNFKSDINWKLSNENINIYNKSINYLIGEKGLFIKTKKRYLFQDNDMFVGLHPSCTTEISNNKNNGCVDKNLKIFDYKNIYVCGSSVFKLNGFTNPTWTIMSLANRLSNYLVKKQK